MKQDTVRQRQVAGMKGGHPMMCIFPPDQRRNGMRCHCGKVLHVRGVPGKTERKFHWILQCRCGYQERLRKGFKSWRTFILCLLFRFPGKGGVMSCTYCGADMDSRSNTCSKCGHEYGDTPKKSTIDNGPELMPNPGQQ
jgi:hypothetical protein